MVFFTAGAQIIDAIIVKVAVFAAEQAINVIKWGGSSIYGYYRPAMTECEKLRLENLQLRQELDEMERLEKDDILILKEADY